MLWAKETDPINLKPESGAEPTKVFQPEGCFSPSKEMQSGFHSIQAVQFTSTETQEWNGDKSKTSLARSSEEMKAQLIAMT